MAGIATDGNRALHSRHGACLHRVHIIQTDTLKSFNHDLLTKKKNHGLLPLSDKKYSFDFSWFCEFSVMDTHNAILTSPPNNVKSHLQISNCFLNDYIQ